MDELIDQYPMEVVVEKNNDVVYNSVPVLGSNNMIGKLNQEALLIESQGTYNGYDLWFALYHVPNATYMAPFMKKQGVIYYRASTPSTQFCGYPNTKRV